MHACRLHLQNGSRPSTIVYPTLLSYFVYRYLDRQDNSFAWYEILLLDRQNKCFGLDLEAGAK